MATGLHVPTLINSEVTWAMVDQMLPQLLYLHRKCSTAVLSEFNCRRQEHDASTPVPEQESFSARLAQALHNSLYKQYLVIAAIQLALVIMPAY